ncbi:hypothetical protein KM043_012563 [Ampulex compressa]|nr:hypothetical protein KM043_012563 [Ampulex compressa]
MESVATGRKIGSSECGTADSGGAARRRKVGQPRPALVAMVCQHFTVKLMAGAEAGNDEDSAGGTSGFITSSRIGL